MTYFFRINLWMNLFLLLFSFSAKAFTPSFNYIQLAAAVPVATDDYFSTLEETAVSGNVGTNDSDPDGDPINYFFNSVPPTIGSLNWQVNGSFTFTPYDDFYGTVDIDYQACDNQGGCATATLHIEVEPVNDQPEVVNEPASVVVTGTVSFCMDYYDVDPGDSHSVSVCEMSTHGVLTYTLDPVLQQLCVSYTGNTGYCGPDWTCLQLCDDGFPQRCDSINILFNNDCGGCTDVTPPVVHNVPADITVNCDQVPPVPTNVTATDNEDTDVTLVFMTNTVEVDSCTQLITRLWKAIDDCTNTNMLSQVITVTDLESPLILGVPDVTVSCTEPTPDVVLVMSDNCDLNLSVLLNEEETFSGCNRRIIRTWTATDNCGNSDTEVQFVTFVDDIPPAFSFVPADLTLGCETEYVEQNATATDNCDTDVFITTTFEEDQFACAITRIRTFTATDNCGNSVTAYQTIYINDDIPPVLQGVPQDVTLDCNETSSPANVTGIDNCDNSINVIFSQVSSQNGCNLLFIRKWMAIDDCNNSVSATQTVTTTDTEAPVFVNQLFDLTINCDEIPVAGNPVASDDCDDAIAVVLNETVLPGACPYQIIRVWTATDECGNSAVIDQTLTVVDNEAPIVVFLPGDITVDCSSPVQNLDPVFEDNCDNALEVVLTQSNTAAGCSEYMVRTWTATDDCGNSVTAQQTLTISDISVPTIVSAPPNQTINCDELFDNTDPVFDDNCDADVQVAYNIIFNPLACGSQILRTWVATDDCGNQFSYTQTIAVTDMDSPVIENVPPDITLQCDESLPVNSPAIYDGCDPDFDVTYAETTQQSGCNTLIIRSWTATDHCGNTSVAYQTVTKTDSESPVLVGVPADLTLNCSQAPLPDNVTATDDCDANVVVNLSINTDNFGCSVVVRRTWTATDDCGNSSVATQTITSTDDIAPVFTQVPADLTIACDLLAPQIDPVASDNCDGDLTVNFTETPSGNGCDRILLRSWVATDDCGNSSAVQQTITFEDNNLPVLSGVPANITLNCGDPFPPSDVVTATDICQGNLPVIFSQSNGADNCTNGIVRTWTATDGCGNSATATQLIQITDNTAPTLVSTPSDLTLSCSENLPTDQPVFEDVCDLDLSVQQTTAETVVDCDHILLHTWTATDDCGNTATATQRITLLDLEAPAFDNIPADLTLSCGEIVPDATINVTDDCDATVDIQFAETNEVIGCEYRLIRTWTATDDCGNVASALQTISVFDNTAPILSGIPANITVSCGQLPAPATVTAADACDGNIAVVYAVSNAVNGCTEVVTRSWTATDNCGNQTTAVQVIQVIDNEAPQFTQMPANITANCDEVPAPATPGVTDNCDATPTVTFAYSESTPIGNCSYLFIRYWTATDDCGNSTSITQTITAVDDEAPMLVGIPADITVQCGSVPPVPAEVFANDACQGIIIPQFLQTSELIDCDFNIFRRWTATDACGHTAIVTQTIRVMDQTGPAVITAPEDLTLQCNDDEPYEVPVFVDVCDNDLVYTFDSTSTFSFCTRVIYKTWTATDPCGNSTVVHQTITITDSEAPSIIFVHPLLFGLENGDTLEVACGFQPVFDAGDILVTDECDPNPTLNFMEMAQSNPGCDQSGFLLELICTWKATDDCGNQATRSIIMRIVDDTPPTLTGVPADLTMDCSDYAAGLPAANVIAQDICDDNVDLLTGTTEIPVDCGVIVWRTWLATDDCGNQTMAIQTITVQDLTPPAIVSAPADITISCNEPEPSDQPVFEDACSNMTFTAASGIVMIDCGEEIQRSWTATDECGNSTTVYQKITKVDLDTPVLSDLPADITVDIDMIPLPGSPTATDECDNNVNITFSESVVTTTGCNQVITRTWTATDDCGHSATASQVITVICCQPATVTGADLVAATCGESNGAATINLLEDPAGYTFTWEPDLGLPNQFGNARTDLPGGDYVVTITPLADPDCILIYTLTIENYDSDCCSGLITEEELSIIINDCTGGAAVCLDIPFDEIGNYLITDNGQVVSTGFAVCDLGTSLTLGTGEHQLIVLSSVDCQDTLNVTVTCDPSLLVMTTVYLDSTDTYCLDPLLINGNIISVVNLCEASSGTEVLFTFDQNTLCVDYTGLALGVDTACYYICTDLNECLSFTIITTVINLPSGCTDLIDSTQQTYNVNCTGPETEICLDLPFDQLNSYTITDNSQLYTGTISGCDFDTAYAYTYFSVPGLGQDGPYNVEEWSINGNLYSGEVQDIQGLVDNMNLWDQQGDWTLDELTLTIGGGYAANTYGQIHITQVATNAAAILDVNTMLTPNSTALELTEGQHHLVITNAQGCTDSIDITVACLTPDEIIIYMVEGEVDTVCMDVSELLGTVQTITNTCPDNEGVFVDFVFLDDNVCVEINALLEGTSQGCFVICDEFGVCDTTYVTVIVVPLVPAILPIAVTDYINTSTGQSLLIPVLGNDTLNGELQSMTIVIAPYYGSASIGNDGMILYSPGDFCSDFMPDQFLYQICNETGCDTAWVFVNVWCSQVIIYNGFSPNGDGKNDTFTIEGLTYLPDHQLHIFNRWGTSIFEAAPYLNDWAATWEGKDLPDGTYFYKLDDGQGSTYTGYVQVHR